MSGKTGGRPRPDSDELTTAVNVMIVGPMLLI